MESQIMTFITFHIIIVSQSLLKTDVIFWYKDIAETSLSTSQYLKH